MKKVLITVTDSQYAELEDIRRQLKSFSFAEDIRLNFDQIVYSSRQKIKNRMN